MTGCRSRAKTLLQSGRVPVSGWWRQSSALDNRDLVYICTWCLPQNKTRKINNPRST